MKKIILINLCIILLLLSATFVFAPGVYPIKICNFGEQLCNNKVIEACTESGSGWTPIKTCDYWCESATCVSQSEIESRNKTPWIGIGVFIAIILFLIWFMKKFGNKRIYFSKKHKNTVAKEFIYCKHCGAEMSKGTKFCSECGKKL